MRVLKRCLPSRATAIASTALFVAAGGAAVAATNTFVGQSGEISACVANADAFEPVVDAAGVATRVLVKAGTVRIVKPGETCLSGETPLAFNQTGPAGAAGPSTAPSVYAGKAKKTQDLGSKLETLGSVAAPAGSYLANAEIVIRGEGTLRDSHLVQCSFIGPDGKALPKTRVGATLPVGQPDPQVTISLSDSIVDLPAGKLSVACSDDVTTAKKSGTARHAASIGEKILAFERELHEIAQKYVEYE